MNKDRKEAIKTCKSLIEEKINLIEGVILLGRALRRVANPGIYEEFDFFNAIESEFDTVPIGNQIQNYSKEYLVRKYVEVGSYLFPIKDKILKNARKSISIVNSLPK